jgi:hypothetical protein
MRDQAAREIEKALKQDGDYRIFFVITLEAGRVRPADVTTINTVMDAIKNGEGNFNVIANKLSKLEKRKILEDHVNMALVYEQINSGNHKTNSIFYIDVQRAEDGDSSFLQIEPLPNQFIYQASKLISIAKEDVRKIQTDEFEKVRLQFEKGMEALNNQIKAGNEKYSHLFDRMQSIQRALKESQKACEKSQREAESFCMESKQIQEQHNAELISIQRNKIIAEEKLKKVKDKNIQLKQLVAEAQTTTKEDASAWQVNTSINIECNIL